MALYANSEMVSATEISKRFGNYLTRLKERSLSKIAILKNNRIEAVILPREEYEALQDAYWERERERLKNDPDFRNKRQAMQRLYQEIRKGKEPLRPFGEGMKELYRMIDMIESDHADSEK